MRSCRALPTKLSNTCPDSDELKVIAQGRNKSPANKQTIVSPVTAGGRYKPLGGDSSGRPGPSSQPAGDVEMQEAPESPSSPPDVNTKYTLLILKLII